MFSSIDNIEIHVTDKCIFSCSYCYLKEKENVSDKFFSIQLFDIFLKNIKNLEGMVGKNLIFWAGNLY